MICQFCEECDELLFLKDSFGIEFFVNELLPVEFETLGYVKMSQAELRYVEPLFKIAPQLIAGKC